MGKKKQKKFQETTTKSLNQRHDEHGNPNETIPPSKKSCPLEPGSSPWLMFCHGRANETQTFFSMTDGSYDKRRWAELLSGRFWTTPQGWIIAYQKKSSHRKALCLLNPFSFSKTYIPGHIISNLFFTFQFILHLPRDHPDCRLIMIVKNLYVYTYKLNDPNSKWETYLEGEGIQGGISTKDGKLYFVAQQDRLWTFNRFFRPVRLPHCPEINVIHQDCSRSLVEWKKEIFLIFMHQVRETTVQHIKIFKLNPESQSWTKVSRVRDVAFFISQEVVVACPANDDESNVFRNNHIYYLLPDDMRIYCYDMEDGSTTEDMPCFNVNDQFRHRDWIVMPCS